MDKIQLEQEMVDLPVAIPSQWSREPFSPAERIRTIDDAVAWVRMQNPTPESNRPQDLDWQAIQGEGRKY